MKPLIYISFGVAESDLQLLRIKTDIQPHLDRPVRVEPGHPGRKLLFVISMVTYEVVSPELVPAAQVARVQQHGTVGRRLGQVPAHVATR